MQADKRDCFGKKRLAMISKGFFNILLDKRGLKHVRQKPVPIVYETVEFDEGFRADIIVEEKVILELKSVEAIARVHKKQLLTYIRLADKRLGLLINFGGPLIKTGITRIVNGLQE